MKICKLEVLCKTGCQTWYSGELVIQFIRQSLKGRLHALALLFGNKGTAKDAAVHFSLLVS